MALQISPAVQDAQAKKAVLAGPRTGTLMLELALYKRYHWKGALYEAGVIYKVSREQAVEMLQEEDSGRPIWKVHRKVEKESTRPKLKLDEDGAVDLSKFDLDKPDTLPLGEEHKKPKRIDIGNDDEIADLLVEKTGEDTTI
jgi:hypothetical protein